MIARREGPLYMRAVFIAPKASAEGACILMVFGYYGAIGYYGTCDGLLWDVYDGLL